MQDNMKNNLLLYIIFALSFFAILGLAASFYIYNSSALNSFSSSFDTFYASALVVLTVLILVFLVIPVRGK